MNVSEVLKQLHPLEQRVLPHLKDNASIEDIEKSSSLSETEVLRALHWLEGKGLLVMNTVTKEVIELNVNGIEYKDKGLPEFRLLKAVGNGKLLKELPLSDEEKKISLGMLRKLDAITIERKGGDLFIKKNKDVSGEKYKEFLSNLPIEKKALTQEQLKILDSLSQRKQIVMTSIRKFRSIVLTPLGKEALSKQKDVKASAEKLTSSMLKDGSWRGQEFRPYDVRLKVPDITGGRLHPQQAVINNIRQIFMNMGFKEMEGPLVETAFWCMDSMWIPQDHPSREVHDTFYLDEKGELPKIAKRVGEVHEHGCKTSIKGHGYKWNPEMARQLLLRTHTTATTFRYFGEKNIQPPAKYFYVGRIFRNEAIDATHLPEFHQVEGFVMDEGLTLRDLMGYIREFYNRMGIYKIKFKPTYNPYTEPSMEAIGYNEQLGKWIELINSGIFRPESLEPYGIDVPVIAWGLGVERLSMMITQQQDIRNVLGAKGDLNWLRNHNAVRRA